MEFIFSFCEEMPTHHNQSSFSLSNKLVLVLLATFLVGSELAFLGGRNFLRSGKLIDSEVFESERIGRQLLQVTPYKRFYPNRTTQFDPNPDYFASLIVYAIPGFLIAIASLVIGIVFCICYGTFHKCGRNARSPEKHPRSDVIKMQALLISISVFVAAGCVIGMYGNWLFSKGVKSLLDNAVNATNEVVIKVNNITQIMISIDPAFEAYVQDLNAGLVEIQTSVTEAQDNVYAYNVFRDILVHFGFLTALITGGVGLAAGITREHPVALAMAIMGFITIFMMGSSFGIHLSVSIMMDDLCARASDFITQSDNTSFGTSADQALQIILTCLRNGSFFSAFSGVIDEAQQSLIELNNLTTTYLNYTFDPTLNQSATVEENIRAALSKINGVINAVQAYIDQMPTGTPGRQELQDYVDRLRAIVVALNLLLDIVNCSHVSTFARNVLNSVCQNMLMGTVMIYCGAGILVAVFTVETVFALVGSHRFKRKKIQGIVTYVLAEEYPTFFVFAVAFFTGISFLGFFGAMCKSKVIIFFFSLLQSLGTGLLIGLLIINITTVRSCSNVNDFVGNCTHYQRALDIKALILTSFDVVIALLGMIFAWRLFNSLRSRKKSKEDQNDTNSKSAQRADSFVSPPVNMNGDVADKQVRDINGDADVSDENVNRFIGTPNEPKHLSKRAPPKARKDVRVPQAQLKPDSFSFPPPLMIPAPPPQSPQNDANPIFEENQNEEDQSAASQSFSSHRESTPAGTPGQQMTNIQIGEKSESDPSENVSVSGDAKENDTNQDSESNSLSASEETTSV